ncbi:MULTISPECIES: chloride channel protein [Chitinophagaceae]
MERKKVIRHNYYALVIASWTVAILSIVLAFSIKHLTEFFEHRIFDFVSDCNHLFFLFLPTIGITAIYFLRKYAFHNKKNKGITEIYKTLDQRKDHLPFFKIPSHYINGFLTVIFGGSTGVEVSTVVATAAIGNQIYEKNFSARMYKRELICAGVAAGIAVLFDSPLAGWLFSMEVIARKTRKSLYVSCTAAVLLAWVFIYFFDNKPLLPFTVDHWNWNAMPFVVLLSLLGGALSVYFTLLVTRMKSFFGNISNNFIRVNLGAIAVGAMIFIFPALYGDSYHGFREVLEKSMDAQTLPLLILLLLSLLKPLAAALTLGAGGDGGVFAPSIVAGGFLGLLFASICNNHFGTHLIPLNFALVGAAATLSASIYAPFTALILVCNMLPNGYQLFFPILLGCFVAKFFSQKLLPYNVYTYDFYLATQKKTTH